MSLQSDIQLLERRLVREQKARAEAERLLEDKGAELYRANQSLTELNSGQGEHLKVLRNFALALNTMSTVEQLVWYVVREVVGRLGFSDCILYLYDEDDNCIVQRAAIAEKNPVGLEIANQLRIPLGVGITGAVAASKKAEIVNDVSKDPRYVLDIAPAGSEICVPMLHDGKLIGVIDCEDKNKGFFDDKHLSALQMIASYASAKVAERQAHERLLARTEELEQKVQLLTQLKKELQKSKEKAEESSAMKSRFVATISHEIRTPLAGILGSLDLLQDETLPGKSSALVDMARSSGQTLQTLLNDVIDFARTEAGTLQLEPTAFSIQDLIASVQSFWQPHVEARGASLGIEIEPKVASNYWGDLARIRQILNNYVSNALKYGGSDRIILTVKTSEKGVCFCVTDFGPGLTVEDQAQLFNEFTRVGAHKRQIGDGAGLGLAICKQMAELMGGLVGVESNPGQGSRFWLDLPLDSIEPPQKTSSPREKKLVDFNERLGRRPRVLVAEDVPTNQTIIRMTLEAFGCRVTIVSNGIEAVEAARNHEFDIIFMDIAMPEMDGTTATMRIHALLGVDASPPIYALTAHGMDTDRAEFEAAGMVGIVTKPFKREDLYAAIEKTISFDQKTDDEVPTLSVQNFENHPEFDREVVTSLITQLDVKSQAMLLGQCVSDLSKCLGEIQVGMKETDLERIARATHQLKSVSGTFGLTQIQHLAGEASVLGQQQNNQCLAYAEKVVEKLPTGITALEELSGEMLQEGVSNDD